jgi:predicted enzyme related to lactoylglutathione lyase
MIINQIRTFLPSKDFEESKAFYEELGFLKRWEDEELAIYGIEGQSFFVQKYYVKEWADNLMMQLFVEDIEDTFKVFEKVAEKYKVKIKPIFTADYGRTFHILGPAGELWHVTEAEEKDNKEIICDE